MCKRKKLLCHTYAGAWKLAAQQEQQQHSKFKQEKEKTTAPYEYIKLVTASLYKTEG